MYLNKRKSKLLLVLIYDSLNVRIESSKGTIKGTQEGGGGLEYTRYSGDVTRIASLCVALLRV